MKDLVNMKKTDFVTVANAQVREYEAFLRHLDVIADVAKRMDGKKYTKRFRDAIDEACEVVTEGNCQGRPRFRIYFEVTPQRDCGERFDYSRLYALFYMQNRWVQLRTDRNDVATGTYIDNYMHLSFYLPKALADDRINADNILEAIEETKKRVENDILVLKDAVKRYDFYKRAVKRLEELIGEKAAKINPILRPGRFVTFMSYAQLSANFLENVKNSGKMIYEIVEAIKNRRSYRIGSWYTVHISTQNETFVYCKNRMVIRICFNPHAGASIAIRDVTRYNVHTINAILSGLGCVSRLRLKSGTPYIETDVVEPVYFLHLSK